MTTRIYRRYRSRKVAAKQAQRMANERQHPLVVYQVEGSSDWVAQEASWFLAQSVAERSCSCCEFAVLPTHRI